VAAQILLSIPLPDGKELAARWILDQPAGESSRLLDRVLATSGVPEDLRRRAARVIEKLPGRSFEGRVEVAASRLRSQPGEKEQVFEDLRREAKSPEDKRALASFLVRAGENQRAIDLLPLAAARTRKDCFLVWLDASAGLGRWDEVMNTLKAGQNPLEPALRDLYIARCYEALGQEKSADIYFERAARTPTEDRDLLFYLAGYFNQRGRLPLAEIVLRRLTSDHMASRSAYESLLNIYRTHGNSSGMLGVLDDMRQRWPKDPAVANDRNYLLLLLDRDISRTLERSRLLELENPDLFPLKMTRALAFLRARRPGEGLKIFENSQIQFGQLLPGQKAILSALLQANGMTDAAAAVRNGLEKAQLLPEERALLEK
jgi:tetratricopeptide (TPR) repeat protein